MRRRDKTQRRDIDRRGGTSHFDESDVATRPAVRGDAAGGVRRWERSERSLQECVAAVACPMLEGSESWKVRRRLPGQQLKYLRQAQVECGDFPDIRFRFELRETPRYETAQPCRPNDAFVPENVEYSTGNFRAIRGCQQGISCFWPQRGASPCVAPHGSRRSAFADEDEPRSDAASPRQRSLPDSR